MEIVGLVPCAGKGSRLGASFSKEVFPDLQHPHYRPIIMYTIDAMKHAGIRHIIFTINPMKTDLLTFLGNGKQFGMDFTYCIHPTPRSLPESIDEAFHLLKDKIVAFSMPDTIISPDDYLSRMKSQYFRMMNQCDAVFGCFRTNNPSKFGMVEFDAEHIVKIIDKPKSTDLKWMWGSILWSPQFTELLHASIVNHRETGNELILTELIGELVGNRRIQGIKFPEGSYKDLGTYEEIKEWAGASLFPYQYSNPGL